MEAPETTEITDVRFDKFSTDLADVSSGAVAKRIAANLDGVPGRMQSAALFNNYWQEGIKRIEDPTVGCAPGGPPFNDATGLGWDTSTEPKNKADMIELAKKLNPVCVTHTAADQVTTLWQRVRC